MTNVKGRKRMQRERLYASWSCVMSEILLLSDKFTFCLFDNPTHYICEEAFLKRMQPISPNMTL